MTTISKPLNYPLIGSVLKHMEANKRTNLSLCCPSIRHIDKSTPLKIDSLVIENTSLTINGTAYVLGETREVENQEPSDELRQINAEGGEQWCSRPGDVPVAGDIVIGVQEDRELFTLFTAKQKLEHLAFARRTFFELVDQSLRNGAPSPLAMFTVDFCQAQEDRLAVINAVESFLPPLGLPSDMGDPLGPIPEIDPNDPLAQEFSDAQRAAINCIKNLREFIQEMEANRRDRIDEDEQLLLSIEKAGDALWALLNLTFPPPKNTFLDQFSVISNETKLYLNTLPTGLSLREAFKKLTTRFLGKRLIHVGRLDLNVHNGIIGLPEGLSMKIRGLCIDITEWGKVYWPFQPTIVNSGNLELKELKCCDFQAFIELMDMAKIASVTHVEMTSIGVDTTELWNHILPISSIRVVVIEDSWMDDFLPTVRRFKVLNGPEFIGRRCQMILHEVESFEQVRNAVCEDVGRQLELHQGEKTQYFMVPMNETMYLMILDIGRSDERPVVEMIVKDSR